MTRVAFEPLPKDMPRSVREWAEGLREIARATGLSLRQLADRLHCSPSTLSRYLSGERVVQDAWDMVDPILVVLEENGRKPGVDREELRSRYEQAVQVYRPRQRSAAPEAAVAAAEPEEPPKRAGWSRGRASILTVAAALAAIAVAGTALGWWESAFGSTPDHPPKPSVPTAPLVTANPPATLPGKVVHTWSDELHKFVGVYRFPSATTTAGRALGPNEGDIVQVVCHNKRGRLVHEDHPAPGWPANSTGWYRIYSDNRLWYLPDQYVDLQTNQRPPDCTHG
jgi:transcriptional regulator with XRE-family HTH domain